MPGRKIPPPPPMPNKYAPPPPLPMPLGIERGPHFVTLSPIRSQPPSSKALTARPLPYPQPQSLFLTLLPFELRKKIYTYVFTTTNPPYPTTAHPLSLLSTCRKIHTEAHLIASTTHTFTLNAAHKSPSHDQITARLSALPQRTSIRHIAIHHGEATASLLSAALSIFPALSTVDLRILADTNPLCPLTSPSPLNTHLFPALSPSAEESLRAKAAATYVPHVFLRALHEATYPRSVYARGGPEAKAWGIEWPQLDSGAVYTQIILDSDGALSEELFMDADTAGAVDGVQNCFCGEGEAHVVWTKAVLHRQSERRSVTVGFLPWTPPPQEEKKPETAVVKQDDPGKPLSMPSLCGAGGGGMGYAGSELYWEGLRRRNGDLGAICRGWWRGATTVRGGRSYGVAKSCRIS